MSGAISRIRRASRKVSVLQDCLEVLSTPQFDVIQEKQYETLEAEALQDESLEARSIASSLDSAAATTETDALHDHDGGTEVSGDGVPTADLGVDDFEIEDLDLDLADSKISKVVKRIEKQAKALSSAPVTRFRDKVNFVLGLANICFIGYLLGARNPGRLINYYTVACSIGSFVRWFDYWLKSWHYCKSRANPIGASKAPKYS